jgi:hypothetical protein
MLSYSEARDLLVEHLRTDAAAHDGGAYDAVGRRFDSIERRFPVGTEPQLGRLHIALTFWDGWVDARNNGWPRGPVALEEWPALARGVAADLAADSEISNRRVLELFDIVAHPNLNERVQTLAGRLRARDNRERI